MPRKRSVSSPLHRYARPIMAGAASIGAVVTAYLTIVKLTGNETACPSSGCDIVLSSPYATILGLPLALFGFLAYLSMVVLAIAPLVVSSPQQKELRDRLAQWTKPLLLVGGTSMLVFSGYLMYLLAFEIKALCVYCIGSAILSATLFILALIGQDWPDLSQPLFTSVIVAMVALVGTLGVYSGINNPAVADGGAEETTDIPVTTTSGESEIALAQHLKDIGATFYGAWWCPHCHDQKSLFGQEAAKVVPYVECSPPGDVRSQTPECQAAEIPSYPTWEINGERYNGAISLEELADLSGYDGPRDFQNSVS